MPKREEIIAVFQADETSRALSGLEPREIAILKAKFGVESDAGIVEAVREQLDISGERRRLIEAKTLRKLKHPNRVRRLASYLDGADTEGEK
ncbi:MAG: hypothetical protein RLZZ360_353 [Candidatus Parcubacteria bacterium]|jgi:RNA polymerase primary sigma factor